MCSDISGDIIYLLLITGENTKFLIPKNMLILDFKRDWSQEEG